APTASPPVPTATPAPQLRRGGLRRLLTSVGKIIDLQIKIWLTQAKLTTQRIMLYAALFGAALLIGMLAIIFLYIGTFRLLTDVAGLQPVWAFLIFGGFHAVLATVLILVGTRKLHKKDEESDDAHQQKGVS